MVNHASAQPSFSRYAGAQVLALLNLIGAGVVVFFAMLASGLRCDDNCSPISPGWRNNPDAWQWGATFDTAVVILACALFLNVAVHLARVELRWLAVSVQLAALAFLSYLSLTAQPVRGGSDWLIWLFVFFAGTSAGSAVIRGGAWSVLRP